MKKICCILLFAAAMLAVAACGDDESDAAGVLFSANGTAYSWNMGLKDATGVLFNNGNALAYVSTNSGEYSLRIMAFSALYDFTMNSARPANYISIECTGTATDAWAGTYTGAAVLFEMSIGSTSYEGCGTVRITGGTTVGTRVAGTFSATVTNSAFDSDVLVIAGGTINVLRTTRPVTKR